MDVDTLYLEISGYLDGLADLAHDGEHLWSNYEAVTGILIRLTQIRNEIAYMELINAATPELKKFRTAILDQTIDRFEKVAQYESRKITAKAVEDNLNR